jgi:hypothetical protein
MKPPLRRARQRGSALLIVFVFAAMIAIMLYREMPVATFEAQRQKEELLINRGNEYKRAVKLYVRKFQTFPPSIEALENTNRMRFLRNRYVDPFTHKDDWRLLHAGPGGIIIDSKLKQNQLGPNNTPGSSLGAPLSPQTGSPMSPQTGSPTASSNNGIVGFGASQGFGGDSKDANVPANRQASATTIAFPRRPPAVSVNGGSGSAGGEMTPGLPQDTQQQDTQETPSVTEPPNSPNEQQTANSPDSNQSLPPNVPIPGRFSPGLGGNPASANPQDPQGTMQSLLNNQNPQPTVQTGPSNARGGTAFGANPTGSMISGQGNNILGGGGGIAGVASKSTGHGIKIVNDQTDRSLWEFVYDMQKEAQVNAPGLGTNGTNSTGANSGINGGQAGQPNTPTFGSPNQNNTFGGGFGNTQSPQAPPQPTNQ